ncbi:jg526 [Pararge aegeria aegeria]|uniref:RNA-directed DNA polymerase n=1 Tax=Pararge aegeria aegeria TaxID=348720 RepID=A0A8S4QJL2_9NEOP|nr:jg526 [Pararge aegeria aegeria]
MKNTARSYVYWPGLDGDVEQICKSCAACQQQRDAPPHAPLTPWEFPARPWQRLHADFGEYNGKHYLIIVDAYSKWIEVFQLNSTAAKFVISKFREIFARFGLPLQVVTDGGPPFGSHEMKEYFNRNGIIHNITSPYRPKGNGAAENAVKTVKRCIKKACFEGVEIDAAINKMLFNYRNCEQATTGVAPAVALIGRRLRGRLDILRPDVASRVRSKQLVQIERAGGTQREVQRGDNVFIRNYGRDKTKWVEGQVSDQVGPSSFEVNVPHGTVRRHIDQIIKPARASKRYSLTCTSKDTNGDMTSDFDILPEQPVTAQNSEIISGPERKDHSSDVQSVVKDQVEDDKYELASTSPVPVTVERKCHGLRPLRHRLN